MATILLAWELGAGTGHAMPSASLVNALVHRCHRLLASLRDPVVPDDHPPHQQTLATFSVARR